VLLSKVKFLMFCKTCFLQVDSHKEKDYEHRLAEALADFRQQHEEEMAVYREEVETLYEAKVYWICKQFS